MIAYHFPPLAGSSGIQRTLRFVQQLPEFGWEPLVLTVRLRAYERTNDDLWSQVPRGTVVRRAFALDAARHLSVGNRYPGILARPDRWTSWRFDGVRRGLAMLREFTPCVIWSTYPIATAHLIAGELHRRSGVPWVADFRDPMAQDGYPPDPARHRSFVAIERDAIENAHRCVFATTGAARMYRDRYPEAAERIMVIENGYDEESFGVAEEELRRTSKPALHPGATTLLHSGIVYPDERDPSALFAALGRLRDRGAIEPGKLVLRFRAPVHDDLLMRLADRHGLSHWIEICPPIGYEPALQEMLRADALLVLQGANCNEQIPAKIYEYLRAGRPILCLSDPAGDTAALLRSAGLANAARLESAEEIESALPRFLAEVAAGRAPHPSADAVHLASRRDRSRALAEMFDRI